MGIRSALRRILGVNEYVVVNKETKYVQTEKLMRFKDKNAVVTGGTGSIGGAICTRLAKEGATVFVCGRNVEKLEKNVNDIISDGGNAVAIKLDVSDEKDIDRAFDEILKHGNVDILVNCAGCSTREKKKDLHEQSISVIDEDLNINLRGAILCSRKAAGVMAKQGFGKIINISSIVGTNGKPKHAEYSAAKAGVIALTKSQAIEMGKYGVTVNCVSPGLIPREDADDDKLGGALKTNCLSKVGKPEDISNAVAFFASEEADFITGQNLPVDGGRSLGLKGD